MIFIGYPSHYCYDKEYSDEEIEEFIDKNGGDDIIQVSFSRADVVFRNGEIGLFDAEDNLILSIVPTVYPHEPYRILYPDDDYNSKYFNSDAYGRILIGFEIKESEK